MGEKSSSAALIVVATRFNLVFKESRYTQDKGGVSTRTDEWLEGRFTLFEGICLPSMMAQTDQGFHWLVFFSDRTGARFRERIEGIRRRCPRFEPLFLHDDEDVIARLRTETMARVRPCHTHVVTARVDNDDAYHKEMVALMRGSLTANDDEFINFPHGLQWDIGHGLVARTYHDSGAFIVRSERIGPEQPKTVMAVMHHRAKDTGLLRNVEAPPMWLQVVHDGNLVNRMGTGRLEPWVDLNAQFAIEHPARIRRLRMLYVMSRRWLWRMRYGERRA